MVTQEIPNPPKIVGIGQGPLNKILAAIRGNRLHLNPRQFQSTISQKGTEFSTKRTNQNQARGRRWTITPQFSGGSYSGEVTVGEGTLYAPTNVGTNNPAGDDDPEVTYMLPNPLTVWAFAEPFPVTVEVALGEEVFLEMTWTLRVEELGNGGTPGGDSILLGFWELTTAVVAGGTRATPVYDWALGTATTRFPLGAVIDEDGDPRVLPYYTADLQAVIPIHSERSLVNNVNGEPGGGGGEPTVSVTIENAVAGWSDPVSYVTVLDSIGSGCVNVRTAKRYVRYLAKRYTFDNGVTSQEALVSEVQVTAPGPLLPTASFQDCDPGLPF